MKKVLGSLVLFGVLATGSMADNFPDGVDEECWTADRTYDTKKLIECHKEAIKIYEKQGDYENVYFSKGRLGDLYSDLKDYKNAEKYYLEAIEGAKKIGDKGMEGGNYMALGRIYEKKGDKKKAKEYYTNAYNDFKAIGDKLDAEGVLKMIKKLDKTK